MAQDLLKESLRVRQLIRRFEDLGTQLEAERDKVEDVQRRSLLPGDARAAFRRGKAAQEEFARPHEESTSCGGSTSEVHTRTPAGTPTLPVVLPADSRAARLREIAAQEDAAWPAEASPSGGGGSAFLICTPRESCGGSASEAASEDVDVGTIICGLRCDLEKERKRALELEQHATVLSDRLDQTRRTSGASSTDATVRALEEENLCLRSELNQEKMKVVIELRKAAQSRREARETEMAEITRQLAEKRRLEEELARLRRDHNRDRLSIERALDLEAQSRKEVEWAEKDVHDERERSKRELEDERERSRRELEDAKRNNEAVAAWYRERAEQAEAKSLAGEEKLRERRQTAVELMEELQSNAELIDLFLRHALPPLSAVKKRCCSIIDAGDAGHDALGWQAPELHDPNAVDLKASLVNFVDLMRFSACVLDARHACKKRER